MTDVEKQADKPSSRIGELDVKSILLAMLITVLLGLCGFLLFLDRDVLMPRGKQVYVEDKIENALPLAKEVGVEIAPSVDPEVLKADEPTDYSPFTEDPDYGEESDAYSEEDDYNYNYNYILEATTEMGLEPELEEESYVETENEDVEEETEEAEVSVAPHKSSRIMLPYSLTLDVLVYDDPEHKTNSSPSLAEATDNPPILVYETETDDVAEGLSATELDASSVAAGNSSAPNSTRIQMKIDKDLQTQFIFLNKILSLAATM